MVEGMYVVVNFMLSLMSDLSQLPIGAHDDEVMYFGSFGFKGEFVFQNCDDIHVFVVNTQFELVEFGFSSVCVELKYIEMYLIFTGGYVCLCSHVVILGLCVWGRDCTLCGCRGCRNSDACTVVCVEYVHAEKM